jgi:ribosomal protein L18E
MSDQEQKSVLRKISSTASLRDENTMKRNIACMYEDSKWNTAQESLLSNLERFLKSVNTMGHVVMVPSRLLDIENEEEESITTSSSASDTSSNSGIEQMNMYDAFRTLSDAKDDLIWGTTRDRENELVFDDELSKKFKYHLNALNGLVAHFSDLADELTLKYQTQVEGMD